MKNKEFCLFPLQPKPNVRRKRKKRERSEKIAENPPSCEDQPVQNKNKNKNKTDSPVTFDPPKSNTEKELQFINLKTNTHPLERMRKMGSTASKKGHDPT